MKTRCVVVKCARGTRHRRARAIYYTFVVIWQQVFHLRLYPKIHTHTYSACAYMHMNIGSIHMYTYVYRHDIIAPVAGGSMHRTQANSLRHSSQRNNRKKVLNVFNYFDFYMNYERT